MKAVAALAGIVLAVPAAAQTGGGVAGPSVPSQAQVADGTANGAPASGRTVVQPYIELGQVLAADLRSGDVLTYTTLAAGVDASIATARAQGQASYRYERRIGWGNDLADSDVHAGLARGFVSLTRGLSLEGGALATRVRSDIRGDAPGVLVGNVGNTSQLYSAYVGPSYTGQLGVATVNANYRLGYTKVEVPSIGGISPTLPRLDYFDDSWNHIATASIGVAPGVVATPGFTASGAYERETAGQLSGRYEGWYGRGDVLWPVSPYVALVGGVGYERIETSQRDALRGADGAPVLDGDGRFVTDPASPRRIAYRTDGVYYDVGVMWRPNRRTALEARVGERFGSISYTGSLRYQASRSMGVAVVVYDGVQTFGRQLRTGLASLPTSFIGARDVFGQGVNGCVFSTSGTTPGGCLNDVFQSVQTASYRARGVDGIVTVQRGLATWGAGAGYANRRLFSPNVPGGVVLYGLEDESWYGQLFYARQLNAVSGVDLNAFINHYSSELAGADDVVSVGATASYYRNFGRLGTTASVGLYHFQVGDLDSALSAQALIAARYYF